MEANILSERKGLEYNIGKIFPLRQANKPGQMKQGTWDSSMAKQFTAIY